MLEFKVRQRTMELDQALQRLSEASERLKEASRIDSLTGAKNRAYFAERLEFEWHRALRTNAPIGLLMVDIDHFKEINDTFGHLGGDACLRQVATAIKQSVHRCSDEFFRYGGEEFVVMLPGTDIHGAAYLGEVIRRSVESLDVTLNERKVSVTISIGAASFVPKGQNSSSSLIGAADDELYQAKRNGRNQVRSKIE